MNSPHPRRYCALCLILFSLAALGLVSCATDSAPTASDEAALTQAAAGRTVLSLWAPDAPAAKKTGGRQATDEALKAARDRVKDAVEAAREATGRAEKAQKEVGRAEKAAERAAEALARCEGRGDGRAAERARESLREALQAAAEAIEAARLAAQEAADAEAQSTEASGVLAKMVGDGEDDTGDGEAAWEDDAAEDEGLDDPGRVSYEAAPGTWTVSGVVGPKGGKLTIADEGSGRHDDLSVTLTIPGRALSEPVDIEMSLLGQDKLSTLQVLFSPTGTTFEKDAILVVQVGKDRVDVDVSSGQIKVEHEDTDEESYADMKAKDGRGGSVTLIVKVSGFSVYTLGGGR